MGRRSESGNFSKQSFTFCELNFCHINNWRKTSLNIKKKPDAIVYFVTITLIIAVFINPTFSS